MFVLWYLVLVSWVLVTSSTPVVLPLASELQDYAELAQRSSGVSRPQNNLFELVLSGSSLPDRPERISSQSTSVLSPRAVIPLLESLSTDPLRSDSSPSPIMAMALQPNYSAIFPILSYSTLLAIIGFISMRIAKWRQRRTARQEGFSLDRNSVELLPTSTATISPRFRDLPVPPPLPPTSPNLPRSASVTSFRSLSSPRPSSPVSNPWPQSRLSRELERPKSPVQHLGFSPGAKIKRRSTSLDLGSSHHKKRHTGVPTPLRRPFFVSEPEPDHEHLLSSQGEPYRDYDDDDEDDMTLIHFSPSHQRAKSQRVHTLWHSSPNTPFTPSHPDTTLIDFTSSSTSLDKLKTSTPTKHGAFPSAAHTAAWAFDINIPRTPPPHPSLQAPLAASKHRRSRSSSSELNLIDFSPRMKEKMLTDVDVQEIVPRVIVDITAAPQPVAEGKEDTPTSEKEKEKGYEGGDEDEMDITWGGEWRGELRGAVVAGGVIQREKSMEKDVVDDVQKLEGGLLVVQPLSAAPSTSSESDSAVLVVEEDSFENVEILDVPTSVPAEEPASVSPSPVVASVPVEQEPHLETPAQHEAETETTLVKEEEHVLEVPMDAEQCGREEEEVINESIHDSNETDDDPDDVAHLAQFPTADKAGNSFDLPPVEDPVDIEASEEAVETETTAISVTPVKVSLPPSPVSSICDTLPEPETSSSGPVVAVEAEEDKTTVDEEAQAEDEHVLLPGVEHGDEEREEVFPDPDLLPLPELPLPSATKSPHLDTSVVQLPSITPLPLSPSPSLSPHQIPTPPASPPSSPRMTGLSNITNRPAWSMRAADMPPLGIHANGANTLSVKKSMGDLSGKRNDENWDAVKRRRVEKVKEKNPKGEAEVEAEAKTREEKEDEKEKEEDEVDESAEAATVPTLKVEPAPLSPAPAPSEALFSPTISMSSLPGAFPTDTSTQTSLTAAVDRDHTATKGSPEVKETSKSLAVPTTSARRRTATRSPIDIALAMQLRPGLGLGADPAWMVRFLMAMFGWFVVMISGSSGDTYKYGPGMGGAFVGARRRD